MNLTIREFTREDMSQMLEIWNAVVATNYGALHLYEKLGFVKLGVIPKGFLKPDGAYEDIIPHYCIL